MLAQQLYVKNNNLYPFSCVCRCRRVQWPPGEESGVPQTSARALSGTSDISATLRKLRHQPNKFGRHRGFPPPPELLRRLASLRKASLFLGCFRWTSGAPASRSASRPSVYAARPSSVNVCHSRRLFAICVLALPHRRIVTTRIYNCGV